MASPLSTLREPGVGYNMISTKEAPVFPKPFGIPKVQSSGKKV